MKNLSKLFFLHFLLLGFAAQAQAQTETVASAPKKLQQLYLSVGTGPAATTHKYSNPLGGAAMLNFTYATGPSNLFRLNIQHSGFTSWLDPAPGPFDFFTFEQYNTEFFVSNTNTAITLSFGKKQRISNLLQIQGLAGLGINSSSTFEIEGMENIEGVRCGNPYIRNYVNPGVLLQAEAMFLPSKFAGCTFGAYANLIPKFSTAGLNVSLNLGKLK